jgi:hypothetical protein
MVKGWSRRKPDTKASHGIGGGGIRKSQKARESSTLSACTMFCSGVELSSLTSICVINFLVCNDVLQHLRKRPGRVRIDSVRMS